MKGIAILCFCVALTAAKPREAEEIRCSADDESTQILPHDNCNQFYQCVGETHIVKTCPTNLLFNTELEICDWPRNVDCHGRVIPEDHPTDGGDEDIKPSVHGHSDPSQAPEICAAEDSEGVLVAHENCNEFYICEGHHPVALKCPDNLLYNPEKEQCDWPENVNCGERITLELKRSAFKTRVQENNYLTNAKTVCAQENSKPTFLPHEYCNYFYYCQEGLPKALLCPARLMFDMQGYCDWPFKVQCGDRTIGFIELDNGNYESFQYRRNGFETNQVHGYAVPSKAPEICAAKSSDSVLVAHENCTQFYQCTNGAPLARDCPEGLLYHPEIEICDWPRNVNCGERIYTVNP